MLSKGFYSDELKFHRMLLAEEHIVLHPIILSVCLSVCVSAYMFASLSVCLSVLSKLGIFLGIKYV